ncbi:uncharacterized protein B0I36DRAFT_253004 [Microdochium trichocladiopsis]|uniref:Fumarylacetoacetate hydrolase n=1 Tax=Microdochium trichocladiopsis TaxID=1682393 RepID=A0A9P9BMP1_9PEZI|nr:uncharacterized protein B0I36DRAFT_253004 [Microdochium trichocladiopsis]KAH7018002.1 hypothetical protein B0I36DRAFT_253004 [Microdochium trichocladiopsis]
MAQGRQYVAFTWPDTGVDQIGHLDQELQTVQPLSFASGHPVENLYQLIEAGSVHAAQVIPSHACQPLPLSAVTIRPPLTGRDVLAVGKNYMEHAKEFNSSGYDSSDKVDRPSHPVIFTKRATSIIAHGEPIHCHDDSFTTTADYEGEIGVIIGKPGFPIAQEDAWEHVWGYTIINDITARERQRGHKQFYIGKSADTFCPMGPVAVPKEDLPAVLHIETHVNGELRQQSSTADLIFSIPELIATLSAGQTLQPGDVLATGTPAGVGIGKTPPIFLQPGDEISISVTGLGTLTNKVAQRGAINATGARVNEQTAFTATNGARTHGKEGCLTTINRKPVSYLQSRPNSATTTQASNNTIFVHGLGATKESWTPLISSMSWPTETTLHTYDIEGHGLTPTHPLSKITISSLADDLEVLAQSVAGATPEAPVTIIAHGLGCLIALKFAAQNQALVKSLILVSPPALPATKSAKRKLLDRAALVREKGIPAVVDAVLQETLAGQAPNGKTKPLVETAVRLSLLSQDPEGYAKGVEALARCNIGGDAVGAEDAYDVVKLDESSRVRCPVHILVGSEDAESTVESAMRYQELLSKSRLEVVKGLGYWMVFEDPDAVVAAIGTFDSQLDA